MLDYFQEKSNEQILQMLDKKTKEILALLTEEIREYVKSYYPLEAREIIEQMEKEKMDNSYPDNNPKTRFGIKKPAMSNIPNPGLIHLMNAMADGAKKYGPLNWREKKVSTSIYYDAAMRHLMAWYDGEDLAPDSGVHHLGHAMACLVIILDGLETGNAIDNRPPKGNFGELVVKYTKKNDS